jgi:N-acetylneuraminic acid mutarotase
MRIQIDSLILILFIITFTGSYVEAINSHHGEEIILAQSNIPTGRCLPAFTYDPVNERIMMFGGGIDNKEINDTWVLDYQTKTWSELNLEISPPARHSAVMVYDSADEVIILFGGYNGIAVANDLWIFDCKTEMWSECTQEISPPGRMSHAMVYDNKNDKVIVFSGYGSSGPNECDIWTYDYPTNTWQEMSPIESPQARYGAGFVYDEADERMLLFGGNDNPSGSTYLSDTWRYDYATDTWNELESTSHPQALKWSCMTYDSINQKAILFGGGSAAFQTTNETWIYDSITNEWVNRNPDDVPPSREAFGFAYDSTNEKGILFGGINGNREFLNDTWAYNYNSNTWEKMEGNRENPQPLIDLYILTITISFIAISVIVYVFVKRRTTIT